MVIPAPGAYIKVAAVEKLVVEVVGCVAASTPSGAHGAWPILCGGLFGGLLGYLDQNRVLKAGRCA